MVVVARAYREVVQNIKDTNFCEQFTTQGKLDGLAD